MNAKQTETESDGEYCASVCDDVSQEKVKSTYSNDVSSSQRDKVNDRPKYKAYGRDLVKKIQKANRITSKRIQTILDGTSPDRKQVVNRI